MEKEPGWAVGPEDKGLERMISPCSEKEDMTSQGLRNLTSKGEWRGEERIAPAPARKEVLGHCTAFHQYSTFHYRNPFVNEQLNLL